jgi:hypothetical protein
MIYIRFRTRTHKLRTNHTVRSSDRLSPLSRWNCDMNCKHKRRCRITWTRQDAVDGPEEPRSHWQGSKAHHPPFGSNKDLLRNPSHQQGEQSSVYVLVPDRHQHQKLVDQASGREISRRNKRRPGVFPKPIKCTTLEIAQIKTPSSIAWHW